jgi:ATP-grasp domain, R2K clade family 2
VLNDLQATTHRPKLNFVILQFAAILDVQHRCIMERATILLMPEKTDEEFEQVSAAAAIKGLGVRRMGKYWIRDDELLKASVAVYGSPAFAFVLAQLYNLQLISPDDTLIARLERKWVKRTVTKCSADRLTDADFPAFIKPVVPKLFSAGVFQSLAGFKAAAGNAEENEEILMSGIIAIRAEARSFVLHGAVVDIALYEGDAEIEEGRKFLMDFLSSTKDELPPVLVIDIAYNDEAGWFVLEFNACWGAGLNNCAAEKVIDCIVAASVNKE